MGVELPFSVLCIDILPGTLHECSNPFVWAKCNPAVDEKRDEPTTMVVLVSNGGVIWYWCRAKKNNEQVLGQLSQVTDHVRVIQETTNTTNELLKYRIEEAFTDIQRLVAGTLSAGWTSWAKRLGMQ